MEKPFHSFFRVFPVLVVTLLVTLLTTASSCDEEDFNRTPPPGQGSLIIDNNTSDDLDFFINGSFVDEVRDRNNRGFDFDPGTYRVVLEQQGGDHSYREDIDILEGRVTVLDVAFGNGFDYDVIIFFE